MDDGAGRDSARFGVGRPSGPRAEASREHHCIRRFERAQAPFLIILGLLCDKRDGSSRLSIMLLEVGAIGANPAAGVAIAGVLPAGYSPHRGRGSLRLLVFKLGEHPV